MQNPLLALVVCAFLRLMSSCSLTSYCPLVCQFPCGFQRCLGLDLLDSVTVNGAVWLSLRQHRFRYSVLSIRRFSHRYWMRQESSFALLILWPRSWCEETHIMRLFQLSIGDLTFLNRTRQNGHSFDAGGPTSLKWVKLCSNHSPSSVKVWPHCEKLNGQSKIGSCTGGNTRLPF